MPKCSSIRSVRRKVCIGDLRTPIILEVRFITPPVNVGDVDFSESFSNQIQSRAMIKTVKGETAFDKTNAERIITHHFYIRFRSDVSAETWVEMKGEKLDVINTENLDERSEFLLLRCSKRGINANPANLR